MPKTQKVNDKRSLAYLRISTNRKRWRNQKEAHERKFIGCWKHFEKVSILTLVTEDFRMIGEFCHQLLDGNVTEIIFHQNFEDNSSPSNGVAYYFHK